MLFNSFIYLFAFLPMAVVVFFLLNRSRRNYLAHLWLVLASLTFYSYWKLEYLPIIIASMTTNYLVGRQLGLMARNVNHGGGKVLLWLGIAFNIGLLGYYKYADFMIGNINSLLGRDVEFLKLALPLAISFFTFQQIAYLVDSHKGLTHEYSFFNYCLFVSFFPQLIAGPIVHHKEMMPQFANLQNKKLNWDNVYIGLFLLGFGLFKKVAVADSFGTWANEGYSDVAALNFLTAWKTSICYTIQLYFDFSGYTDMALGSARMLNIDLPLNFNSPYRALSIQDFWRRWHMTLSRFLRYYIYIPLGGNRRGEVRTCFNVFLTFLIGGIWHGAGWTFVLWGAMHGAGLVINRLWNRYSLRLPKPAAWLFTFLFVNFAWVYFRALTVADANTVLLTMLSPMEMMPGALVLPGDVWQQTVFWLLAIFILQDIFFRNSQTWAEKLKVNPLCALGTLATFWISTHLLMLQNRFSEFLYFQF